MNEETNENDEVVVEVVEVDGVATEISPADMVVIVRKGAEYQASDRIEAALAELANALAAEETAEVAGFNFDAGMALDGGFISSPEPLGIGCVRIGCLRGGDCNKTVCRGSYEVKTL